MEQRIFRAEDRGSNNPYVKVDSNISKKKVTELSDNAFRILIYMLSKPDNWRFFYANMTEELGKSDSTIRRGISELKDQGYVRTVPLKSVSGNYIGWDIYVYEKP